MEMKLQILSFADSYVEKQLTKNPHKSISTIFRHLKGSGRFSMFGDFPLLKEIVDKIVSLEIPISQYQIMYAFRESGELRTYPKKIKSQLLEQLWKPSSVALKFNIKPLEGVEKHKTNKSNGC